MYFSGTAFWSRVLYMFKIKATSILLVFKVVYRRNYSCILNKPVHLLSLHVDYLNELLKMEYTIVINFFHYLGHQSFKIIVVTRSCTRYKDIMKQRMSILIRFVTVAGGMFHMLCIVISIYFVYLLLDLPF